MSGRIRGRTPTDPLSSKLALDFLFGALAATVLLFLLRSTEPIFRVRELMPKLEETRLREAAASAAADAVGDAELAWSIREHLVAFPHVKGDVLVLLDYSGSIVSAGGFGLLYRTVIEEVAFNAPDVRRVKLHAFNTLPNVFDAELSRAEEFLQRPRWIELQDRVPAADSGFELFLSARAWPASWRETERLRLWEAIERAMPSATNVARKFGQSDEVGAALKTAVSAFADDPLTDERHIILVGDGAARSANYSSDRQQFDVALAEARRKGVTIHAIAAMSRAVPTVPGGQMPLSDSYVFGPKATGGVLVILPFENLARLKVEPVPAPTAPTSAPSPPLSEEKYYQFE